MCVCVCGGCRTICGWELNILSECMHMLSARRGSTQLILKATQGLPWWSKWLKLHTPNPGAPGLIPGWGTRFHKLQVRHGTTKQMFLKKIQKSNCVCPSPPASLKGDGALDISVYFRSGVVKMEIPVAVTNTHFLLQLQLPLHSSSIHFYF